MPNHDPEHSEHYPPKEKMHRAPFFEDLSQNEKLSEIKPPLVIVCAAIDSKFNMSKRVGKSEIRALSDSRLILLHLIILCTEPCCIKQVKDCFKLTLGG